MMEVTVLKRIVMLIGQVTTFPLQHFVHEEVCPCINICYTLDKVKFEASFLLNRFLKLLTLMHKVKRLERRQQYQFSPFTSENITMNEQWINGYHLRAEA